METKYSERDYCKIGQKCLDFGFNYIASLCYTRALKINPNSNEANVGLVRTIILELERVKTEGRIR